MLCLPTAYSLLLTVYCLLLIAVCLLHTSYFLLHYSTTSHVSRPPAKQMAGRKGRAYRMKHASLLTSHVSRLTFHVLCPPSLFTVYCLLPSPYSLLPTYYLLFTPNAPPPLSFFLLPFLPFTSYFLLITFYLLPSHCSSIVFCDFVVTVTKCLPRCT